MAGLLDIVNQIGEGLAYNTPEAKKKREDEHNLEMWRKKEQLSNDMAIELEERKLALAQKFPEMKQLTVTPYGTILSRTSTGVQELARDDEIRDAYIGKLKSAAVGAQARADVVPSTVDLNTARAEEARARADAVPEATKAKTTAAEAAATRAASTGTPKPATESQQIANYAKLLKAAQDLMPGRTTMQKARAWNALSEEEQNARIEAIRTKATGSTGTVAPATQGLGSFGQFAPSG